MPTDLLDLCQQCKAKYEHSVANLLKINNELEINNQLLQEEINQIVINPTESEAITRFLDLMQPMIERVSQLKGNSPEIQKQIDAFWECRPREKHD